MILVCIVIFLFSNQAGEESSKISNDLIIRKMGHFSEYMVLGFFSFSYLSNIFMKDNIRRNYKKTAILSQIFSVVYASSDEFHQTFVVGRDGNFIDVLIDSSGALVGIIISSIIYFFIVKK
ncbi:MAG: VanZ family protein [Gemella haemolysans]|uniref:VanZ family protein n=1 Tax=Gemella haemolysans TaxID=1379 RepID=UPI0029146F77|nr:VanZ family protein [Gemella haemolysans]MDU6573445.1 VanZ family protein [Gemella haemolysans]